MRGNSNFMAGYYFPAGWDRATTPRLELTLYKVVAEPHVATAFLIHDGANDGHE